MNRGHEGDSVGGSLRKKATVSHRDETRAELAVRHIEGDRFEIAVRSHRFTVDQPVEDGGTDQAPTPTEFFVGGLASCVAYYVRRYLSRHEFSSEGLVVDASYSMASRPARVDSIILGLRLPAGVPDDRRDALLAVASHCTVHNTLVDPPQVTIRMLQPAEL